MGPGSASAPDSSSRAPRLGRCRAAGDGVRGRADVAGRRGRPAVLTHPGSTAAEATSGSRRFQARARATSHALLCAYARRGSVSGPRAAGAGVRPASPEPSQSNRPCSSGASRCVSRRAPGRSPQWSSRDRPPRSALPRTHTPAGPTGRSGRARGPGRPIDGRHQSAPASAKVSTRCCVASRATSRSPGAR